VNDFSSSQQIHLKFTTLRPSTGVAWPFVSGGVVIFKNNLTVPVNSGVTLTTNFGGYTGLNNITIDTSVNTTYYSNGSFFDIVISSGTVDSVSASGIKVADFTLRNDSSLKPVVIGRTLAVDSNNQIDPSGFLSANISLYNANGTVGSGLNKVFTDAYFANIKYNKDNLESRDEFAACWYKNGLVVPSSNLTNPAISVYNTNTGAAVISNAVMAYSNVSLGVVRYNTANPLLIASGEPYQIIVSGTIDNLTRQWPLIIGLDYL
jgi:hypothetical protein